MGDRGWILVRCMNSLISSHKELERIFESGGDTEVVSGYKYVRLEDANVAEYYVKSGNTYMDIPVFPSLYTNESDLLTDKRL